MASAPLRYTVTARRSPPSQMAQKRVLRYRVMLSGVFTVDLRLNCLRLRCYPVVKYSTLRVTVQHFFTLFSFMFKGLEDGLAS